MTFEDLPPTIDDLSLDDVVAAADVVDLFLKDRDRYRNSMLVLLCDDSSRLLQPVVIERIDWHCTVSERRSLAEFLQHLPADGIIVAISSNRAIPSEVAERWRQTLDAAAQDGGPQLMHFFTAIPHAHPSRLAHGGDSRAAS